MNNIFALAILAAIALALNACGGDKRDYWAGVAQGVKKQQ